MISELCLFNQIKKEETEVQTEVQTESVLLDLIQFH
jgi:hypothetical protein